MKNTQIFFAILLFVSLLQSCGGKNKLIKDITGLKNGADITVQGYFTTDPVPMIVSDSIWFVVNTPMPEDQYVLIQGAGLDTFISRYGDLFGAFVTVKGKIDTGKDGYSLGKTVIIPTSIETNGTSSGSGPSAPIVDLNDALFIPVATIQQNKFALLYSGGKDAAQAKNRYWNDLAFMYNTLKFKYGYSDANILVVYKDGVAPNNDMVVDFAATEVGLNSAIASLNAKMVANIDDDYLFVFTTNHGGGYRIPSGASASMVGGVVDVNSSQIIQVDETHENAPRIDETVFCYVAPGTEGNLPPPVSLLIDEVFAQKINTLPFERLITFSEQCFSGGMLRDHFKAMILPLPPDPIRINIAASGEYEYSYSYSAPPISNKYDSFSYLFTAALLGFTHDGGSTINANNDGQPGISVWEAYWYAQKNEKQSSHPIDDNIDGVGTLYNTPTWQPTPTGNADGAKAFWVGL